VCWRDGGGDDELAISMHVERGRVVE